MRAVLDAAAVVALLVDEPAAGEVAEILRTSGGRCSAVNLAEVVDRLSRHGGAPPDAVRAAVAGLVEAGLQVVPCDEPLALRAGALRAQHYHRRSAPVSLADCVAAATAEAAGATLVTSDAALVRAAGRAGVAVHPLPGSTGRRPRS